MSSRQDKSSNLSPHPKLKKLKAEKGQKNLEHTECGFSVKLSLNRIYLVNLTPTVVFPKVYLLEGR